MPAPTAEPNADTMTANGAVVGATERPWFLGSMNDGLFIIDRQPYGSTDDALGSRPGHEIARGPDLVLNVNGLPQERAQAICDAHNSTLNSYRRKPQRGEGPRPPPRHTSEGADMSAQSSLETELSALVSDLADKIQRLQDRHARELALERFIAARAASELAIRAWRASPEGIALCEQMRRRDAENNAYWREIDKGTPARPIGSGGSISAGANSAGRS